jgi:membrane-associated PAP2 superfamily phosphatase
LRFDVGVALVGLLLLLCWDFSGLDLWLSQQLANEQGFYFRHHWILEKVIHGGGRQLTFVVAALLFLNALYPMSRWLFFRKKKIFQYWPSWGMGIWWLISTCLCWLLIAVIKHISLTSCPWSLAMFGGEAQYVSHWLMGVADGGGGKCFPSGHASAIFGLLSIYFFLRAVKHPMSFFVLTFMLLIGFTFGVAQVLRGAHYVSHVLWTAWIAWVWSLCAVRGWFFFSR